MNTQLVKIKYFIVLLHYIISVSYTHLDVYKRQPIFCIKYAVGLFYACINIGVGYDFVLCRSMSKMFDFKSCVVEPKKQYYYY